MKKFLITLFLTASFGFAPLFLSGATDSPVNFDKFEKALSLHKESKSLGNNKAAEKEKKDNESQEIFYSLFGTGKTITANEKCYFKKLKRQPYESFDENRTFTLSCIPDDFNVKLMFVFKSENIALLTNSEITADRFIKIFEKEDNTAFTGKIQFVKDESYYSGEKNKITVGRYDQYTTFVNVQCKILSLKPVKVVGDE